MTKSECPIENTRFDVMNHLSGADRMLVAVPYAYGLSHSN